MPERSNTGNRFQGMPQPLIGFKEHVRYKTTPRRVMAIRGLREDMILLLGLPGGLVMAWFLWQQEVAGHSGPLSWFFGLIAVAMAILALSCVLVVFWAPAIILDKHRGTITIRQWRVVAGPLLRLRRDEVDRFRVIYNYGEYNPAPGTRPIYTYIHIRLTDGAEANILRLYEMEEADLFEKHFAIPAGIPMERGIATVSEE